MRTVRTTTLSEDDHDLIVKVHGHICPMVLLGARAALAAANEYISNKDIKEQPFGYFRGHGCAVDGIQLFSGCTWGNGNLVLLRGGTFSFVYTSEGAESAVQVTPHPDLLAEIRSLRGGFMDTERGRLFSTSQIEDIFRVEWVKNLGSLSLFPESL